MLDKIELDMEIADPLRDLSANSGSKLFDQNGLAGPWVDSTAAAIPSADFRYHAFRSNSLDMVS